MQKLWEALNRAGIVWGAFWFAVWVAGSLLLRGVASIIMKLGISDVNTVLVPLTAKIDAGLGVALQGVVWVLTFPLKGFEGVSGFWGFVGATVVSTLSLFVVLFVLTLAVAGAEAWKNFVFNGGALVVNSTKFGVDAAQDIAAQKAREVTFLALQALVTKYPALNGLPRSAGALPMPSTAAAPPAHIALTNAEAWRVFNLKPELASAYGEPDVRKMYTYAVTNGGGDAGRYTAAWVNICSQRGWRP